MRLLLVACAFCYGFSHFAIASCFAGGVGQEGGGFSFGGKLLFYSWGGQGEVPQYGSVDQNYFLSGLRTLGDVLRGGSGVKEDLGLNGDCSFSGRVAFEHNGDSGVVYGVDFQMLTPAVRDNVERGQAVINHGSRVFVSTSYGKFSVGRQEGVESIIGSGFRSRYGFGNFLKGEDFAFVRYRLPVLQSGGFMDYLGSGDTRRWFRDLAILYPGLYSEGVFRANEYVDYYGMKDDSRKHSRYFVNNLPVRISYQSPNFFGLRFGLSYSPTGYDAQLVSFESIDDTPLLRDSLDLGGIEGAFIKGGSISARYYRGAAYESVRRLYDLLAYRFSGLFSLGQQQPLPVRVISRRINPFFRISSAIGRVIPIDLSSLRGKGNRVPSRVLHSKGDLVGAPAYSNIVSGVLSYEYALDDVKVGASVAGEYARPRTVSRSAEEEFCDLAALAVSLDFRFRGLSLAGLYGYLGNSGYSKDLVAGGRYSKESVLLSAHPSFYWALGAGYEAGPLRVSGSYFSSLKGGSVALSKFNDLGVRVDYRLYGDSGEGVRCFIFVQLDHVRLKYDFSAGLYAVGEFANLYHMDAQHVVASSYSFDVGLVGMGLAF